MARRLSTIAMLTFTAAGVCACGGTTKYANKPRPPLPANLTVYINQSRVSVSPARVGAGLAVFIITNQASRAEGLSVAPAGSSGGQSGTSTGPINPQGTAQISVQLQPHTSYTLTATSIQTSASTQATPGSIAPASISVGKGRPTSGSALLYP